MGRKERKIPSRRLVILRPLKSARRETPQNAPFVCTKKSGQRIAKRTEDWVCAPNYFLALSKYAEKEGRPG